MLGQMTGRICLSIGPYRLSIDRSRPDPGGNAQCHRPCGDLGPRGNDGTCPDERRRPADHALEHDCARADQDEVLQHAALEMREMADHTVGSDPRSGARAGYG